MKKLSVSKSCEYCKAKVAHIIVLGNENGKSHVHAPFGNKPWMGFLIGALNAKLNPKNKKEK
jgi:hypothetical protein